MNKMKNSKRLLKQARKVIPGLSQTFSKAPYSYVEGIYPTYLNNGKGSHVTDVDNNEYIDYVLALGPVILGYNYSKVNQAIINQLKKGISFSIAHKLELETSKKIQTIIPGSEMIRFSKTGSDAGTAAIRAARAYTNRNNIAYCGSGGVWHDWFTVITSKNAGIPKSQKKLIKKFVYNDIESLKILFENWHGEIAAVYMEPIVYEYPQKNFLNKIKNLARKNGAVLIFDEVVTGFRYANGGAQEMFNIKADLTVLGKGIANGMPLGAITGSEKIMKQFENVFYSTSYGGETLSLAAASAVIDELQTKPIVSHCWKLGNLLISNFNKIAQDLEVNIRMEGLPIRSSIVCRDENNKESLLLKSLFFQETIKRGVLFGPGAVLLCYSHSKSDIQKTLNASEKSMKIVKNAIKNKNVKKTLKGKIMKRVMTF